MERREGEKKGERESVRVASYCEARGGVVQNKGTPEDRREKHKVHETYEVCEHNKALSQVGSLATPDC